jgi:hypothetical protein
MNYGELLKATDATHRALLSNPENAYAEHSVKMLCAMNPHSSWIKKNPYANNSEYLPIDKIEYLLDSLYKEWQIEIRNVMQTDTSATVAIRLHYQNRKTDEWLFHDGVASEPYKRYSETQEEKATFSQLMRLIGEEKDIAKRVKMQKEYYELRNLRPIKEDAEKAAFQIAKSAAIKDATDHLGKLFGRDLNRKNTIEFAMDSEPQPEAKPYPKQTAPPVTTAEPEAEFKLF